MVGRPVSRIIDDGWTLEVTRCCVLEGYKNASSVLYGAAWGAAKAMGYKKMVTYTLESEPGTSIIAAGWRFVGIRGGRSWNWSGRPRVDKHPLGAKKLFEIQRS